MLDICFCNECNIKNKLTMVLAVEAAWKTSTPSNLAVVFDVPVQRRLLDTLDLIGQHAVPYLELFLGELLLFRQFGVAANP